MVEKDLRWVLKRVPDLLPCPFCGGAATFRSREFTPGWPRLLVGCTQCSAEVVPRSIGAWFEYAPGVSTTTAEFMAARAWNARPGAGTTQCAECGLPIPHVHRKNAKGELEVRIVDVAAHHVGRSEAPASPPLDLPKLADELTEEIGRLYYAETSTAKVREAAEAILRRALQARPSQEPRS